MTNRKPRKSQFPANAKKPLRLNSEGVNNNILPINPQGRQLPPQQPMPAPPQEHKEINPLAKKIGEVIGNSLKNAAQKAAQEQAQQTDNDPTGLETPQPQGQLPIPDAQVVFEDRYEWVWEPVAEECHVYCVMNRELKTFDVRISMVENNLRYTPDEAKLIGEALLAAWNYQFVWKDNFADMFDNGLQVKPLPVKKATPRKRTAKKAAPLPSSKINDGDLPIEGEASFDNG